MKSREICIVHISDLHFKEGKYRSVCNELIEDISAQIKGDENLVLVVTGDLVSEGRVKESYQDVINFFKKLLDSIPPSTHIIDCEIVAGNHDIRRPDIAGEMNGGTYIGDETDFNDLKEELSRIFKERDIPLHGDVGISHIEYNGKKVAFVRLDTSSYGTFDELKKQVSKDFEKSGILQGELWNELSVENVAKKRWEAFSENLKEQVKSINKAYGDIVSAGADAKPYLTLSVSHHPLTTLGTVEDDDIADVLFKNDLYFVDMILCGHKHKAHFYYTIDNVNQKVMLMSGVGRQETQDTAGRYSLYRLSLERNTCQVKVRRATEGSEFNADTTIKGGGLGEFAEFDQYVLPLKADKVGGVIYLATRNPKMRRGLFVDQETLRLLPSVSSAVRRLQARLHESIIEHGAAIGLELNSSFEQQKTFGACLSRLASMFKIPTRDTKRFRDMVYNLSGKTRMLPENDKKAISAIAEKRSTVERFLVQICCHLADALRDIRGYVAVDDASGHRHATIDPEWRIHYRVYQGKALKNFKKERDWYIARGVRDSFGKKVSSVPRRLGFVGLIKGAFEIDGHSLIESAVPDLNENRDTEWCDFMTICPEFSGSTIEMRDKSSDKSQKRPLITFGISLKCNNFETFQLGSRILYLLEYLRVCEVIESAMDRLVSVTCVDPDLFRQLIK